MKKKILIFGSNGQLGSSINKYLSNSNYSVVGFNSLDGNLLNKKEIKNIFFKYQPSIVINTAAMTDVDECEDRKKECHDINAHSLRFLSKCCLINNTLLIHFSTDYIFNSEKIFTFSEKNIPKPINYYGKCKLIAEKNIINSGCNYLIFRISWLFSENKNNFLNFFLKKIKNNKEIKISNNFSAPTSSRVIVNVLKFFLKSKMKNYKKIFHLSCNGIASWENIFLYILEKKKFKNYKLKYNLVEKIETWTAKRPYCSHLSCNKIEKFLKIDLPHWKKELNYYLKNYG